MGVFDKIKSMMGAAPETLSTEKKTSRRAFLRGAAGLGAAGLVAGLPSVSEAARQSEILWNAMTGNSGEQAPRSSSRRQAPPPPEPTDGISYREGRHEVTVYQNAPDPTKTGRAAMRASVDIIKVFDGQREFRVIADPKKGRIERDGDVDKKYIVLTSVPFNGTNVPIEVPLRTRGTNTSLYGRVDAEEPFDKVVSRMTENSPEVRAAMNDAAVAFSLAEKALKTQKTLDQKQSPAGNRDRQTSVTYNQRGEPTLTTTFFHPNLPAQGMRVSVELARGEHSLDHLALQFQERWRRDRNIAIDQLGLQQVQDVAKACAAAMVWDAAVQEGRGEDVSQKGKVALGAVVFKLPELQGASAPQIDSAVSRKLGEELGKVPAGTFDPEAKKMRQQQEKQQRQTDRAFEREQRNGARDAQREERRALQELQEKALRGRATPEEKRQLQQMEQEMIRKSRSGGGFTSKTEPAGPSRPGLLSGQPKGRELAT